MRATVTQGDITQQQVDAVVNAANSSLLGGGGVDGAIHRVGGPSILAECRKLRAARYPGGLPTGEAVVTSAGNLPARWVIHTVGPVYSATEDRTELLRSCYVNSLRHADEMAATSIAFPLISSGVYRWPVDDAIQVALQAMIAHDNTSLTCSLITFDSQTGAKAQCELERLQN